MHDVSNLTTIAVWTALGLSLLWLTIVAVRHVFFPIFRRLQEEDEESDGAVIWCSYEVTVDKDGAKYFVSTLPDGVQPIPIGYVVEIGPGLPRSRTRVVLSVPGSPERKLKLPVKLAPEDLDEGTVIRVRVVR